VLQAPVQCGDVFVVPDEMLDLRKARDWGPFVIFIYQAVARLQLRHLPVPHLLLQRARALHAA